MNMKRPIIKDYIGLRDGVIEELRSRKQVEIQKLYPNKLVIVSKDMKVWVSKFNHK